MIVDEASMAYVPQIIYAATLARKKLIVFGDMKQLAPIAHTELLRKDIYDYLHMNDTGTIKHQWLVMLDEQYRTDKSIVQFINRQYYNGRIKTNLSNSAHINSIIECAPFENKSIVLLDTEGLYATSCKTLEFSRLNYVNAVISIITATKLCRNNPQLSIGIITPYAAQAKLIKKILKDDTRRKYNIECATVHQFQGNEKDVIIFDTVDNYPLKQGMLTGYNKDHSNDRLVNVALSRAKGKLIVVANSAYLQKEAKKDNPFYKLLKFCQKDEKDDKSIVLKGIDLKDFIEQKRVGKIKVWDDDDYAAIEFIEDLRLAEKSIQIMFSRGHDIHKESVEEIKSIAENVDIDLVLKSPTIHKELDGLLDYLKIIERDSLPIAIIDDRVIWYGIPDMTHKYYYNDSVIPEHDKIMIRLEGQGTSRLLDNLLDFRNDTLIVDSKKNGELLKEYVSNIRCPKHGVKYKLIYNKHYYKRCYLCEKPEYLSTYEVNDFLYERQMRCPNDDGKLTCRLGSYGLYLKCSERHEIPMNKFFEI